MKISFLQNNPCASESCYNPFYFQKSAGVWAREYTKRFGGLIFSPNHQGAFLDPITSRNDLWARDSTHSQGVTCLEVALQWFLDALKMLPVYRIRDGYQQPQKKQK